MQMIRVVRAMCAWLMVGLLAACGGGGPGGTSTDTAAAAASGARKQALATGTVLDFAANGWYWNPRESGTGFMFEAQGSRGFVGFFMYEEGTGKPVWYVSEGAANSFVRNADGTYTYSGDLRVFSGGQPAWSTTYVNPTSRSVGNVTITFSGNDASAQLPSRVMTATRFDFNGLGSTTNTRQPELGWYWNPAEGGRGWAMEVQNNRLFMAMFHYNQDGSPTWNVVEADIPDGSATGTFILYANGQSLDSAFRQGNRHDVGSFSLSFRNPCAGQVQLVGAPVVSVRRFVFGDLPRGSECHSLAAASADLVPGLEAGPVRLQPGDAIHGRIDADGDVDAYGVALLAGVTYTFELKGAGSSSGTLVDPYLSLHDGALVQLAANNNAVSGLRDSRITYTPSVSGTYYLAARSNGTGTGVGTGTFVLTTTGVAPDLAPLSVLPVASFTGAVQASLTGRTTGVLNLTVDAAGQVTGSVQLEGGVPMTLFGTLSPGGVLSVVSNGVGGSLKLSGIIGPDGRFAGTWSELTGGGGLAVGRSSMQAATPVTLTVRARGTLSAGVGPTMAVRVDGVVIGTTVVQSTVPVDHVFTIPHLAAGAKVDVVFTNDANANGEDRNLYVHYVALGNTIVLPTLPGATVDWGSGARAFDGLDVVVGRGELTSNGALRLTWPGATAGDPNLARKFEAARLLQQATFGASTTEIDRLVGMGDAAWLADQLARPHSPDFVNEVQRLFAQGDAYRPGGANYTPMALVQKFWATANTAPDQLRKRTAFSLHQIFMVSLADSNLWEHSRPYANYLDTLNRHAFGSYRGLLEDISLSPVMGIYLSHIRNRKENPATGLLPDENYAREVMQLFSIGLQELNPDGSLKLDANGKPIETYTNADVMAMAKVFTGWSWAFPDAQLTDSNFRWGSPSYKSATDTQIDLQRMKAYPGQHSTAEKVLFAGKPWAVTIPAGSSPQEDLRLALDALANHPNVGPFIGRQLIQRLTTSNPSPAYVSRVAAVFANNGQGVRGDLGAVVRAILLDPEARQAPATGFGKLKEPILRVSNWMRAMDASSVTGNYLMTWDLDGLTQRPYHAPSVFSYFRPGYIPPNSALSEANATAPEFQIVNESTAPAWINLADSMAGNGLGWTGTTSDVTASLNSLIERSTLGDVDGILQHLNLVLFAGRMPPALRQDILDAVTGVSGSDANSHRNRARVAVFMALTSPEFLVQR